MILSGILKFSKGLLKLPLSIKIWLGWIMLVNMGGSIIFIKHTEAVFILVAMVTAAMLMAIITEARGFTRILGLGHIIPWTPLVIFLLFRLPDIDLGTLFGKWIVVATITMVISLFLDVKDVILYLRGDKEDLI